MLLGKARVVPKKFVSISRLELRAVTLSVKVASLFKKELDLDEVEEKFWTEIHRSCREKLIGFREIQTAKMEIIKSVQSRYFGKEMILLSKQKELEANKGLFKLDLYADAQGVLRVGIMIRKSLIQQKIQHPVLLLKNCRITNLIVSWCHDQVVHTGGG